MGRFRARIGLPPLSPNLQRGRETLDDSIGAMGVKVHGRVPAHHGRRREPDVLLAHRAPKADYRAGIKLSSGPRQLV